MRPCFSSAGLRCVPVSLSIALCLMVAESYSGTTVIDVRTEGYGTIVRYLSPGQTVTNLNGAMVWNGTEWVVNSTYAHKYFIDVRTGQRLKFYDFLHFSGTEAEGPIDAFGAFSVSKSVYSYRHPAREGPDYLYQAVQYTITDRAGRSVLLRSRGSGNGTAFQFFEVYIEDEPADQAPVQTTVFRGDPQWYTFPLPASEAVLQADDEAFLTGSLPGFARGESPSCAADYYLDIGGGADLGPAGIGRSFELQTSTLDPGDAPVENPGSCFVTRFQLKFMDSKGLLHKLVFDPAVVSERRDAPLYFPQFANGLIGELPNRSRIILRNASPVGDAGRIDFRDNGGNPVKLPVAGETLNSVPFSIPWWGTREVETEGNGPLLTGSIELISDRGSESMIEGTEVFDLLGRYVSVGAAQARSAHWVYVSRDSTENTGVALYNPADQAVTVQLSLMNQQGEERSVAELTLKAHEQRPRFVDEAGIFQTYFQTHPEAFKGTLLLQCGEGEVVSAIGLIQKRDSGALVAVEAGPGRTAIVGEPPEVPVIPDTVTPLPVDPVLLFPQFVNGEISGRRNRTRLVLKNNRGLTDRGEVRFLSGSGASVQIPVGGVPVRTMTWELPPWGTMEIETDGTGDLTVGSIQVASDAGRDSGLEGTLVFDLLGSFVSVPHAPLRTRHQVYVSRNQNENTGVALHNPGTETLTVDAVLLDRDGVQVGTRSLVLTAGQQLARFINEAELLKTYFDSHPGAFEGSLNLVARDGKQFSLTGLIQKLPGGALIAVKPSGITRP